MHVGSLGYVPPVRTSTAAGKQNVGNLWNKIKSCMYIVVLLMKEAPMQIHFLFHSQNYEP